MLRVGLSLLCSLLPASAVVAKAQLRNRLQIENEAAPAFGSYLALTVVLWTRLQAPNVHP